MQSLIYERCIDRVLEPDHFLHKFFLVPRTTAIIPYRTPSCYINWFVRPYLRTGLPGKIVNVQLQMNLLSQSARALLTNRPAIWVHLWPSSSSSLFVEVQEEKCQRKENFLHSGSFKAIEEIGITSIRKNRTCNNMEEFVDQLIRPFTILLSYTTQYSITYCS